MKTMKKIVAILAVALMLCSILPLSVFAADGDVSISVLGTTGTLASDKLSISWTGGNYSVVNYKASSSTAIRNSDSAHYRVYVGSEFVVSGGAMSQVVIKSVSSYLFNNSANKVSDGWTVSANGNDITYTATSGSADELKITIGKQSRLTEVIITPAAGGSADCDHNSLACGDTCPECGEYTKEHKYANNCVAVCENGCGTANPNYADHVYSGNYDPSCDVCGAERAIEFPEADSELTLAYASEIGVGMGHNNYTSSKYYVTGVVESIANTTYGNLTIVDANGDSLYIYGIYQDNARFDALAEKPEVGMTIRLYGVIGAYNGTAQMKNAELISMEGGCEHEYEFECSTICQLCGQGEREAVCVTDAEFACIDGLCIYCGGDVDAVEHAFDDEWDADCNYGCGYTREVEEKPDFTEATLDFTTLDQRTDYSSAIQVWENGALKLTNNKASSTSNVGNYSNPARFYKSTEVIIAFPGMTSLVIDASNTGDAKYSTAWAESLDAAGLTYTVEEKVYTITFAAPVDSITFAMANQGRANSITAAAVKTGDDECAHNWIDATCTEPKTCSICGAVEGSALGHDWEIISQQEATCTAEGSIVYECAGCGEDKVETFPALPHTYVDGKCSACGAELPLESTITFSDDKAQRTEYSSESQKWENNGLVLINNKAGSSNNIGDFTNPAGRFYKDSEVIISFPGMTSLVIDATGMDTKYLWDNTLTNAGLTFTVEEKIYTITFAEPTDSITLTAANQVRANTITASAVKAGCAHEYDNACDVDCNLCYEPREVQHSVQHVAAAAATCVANGNIEYWYCDVCGMAWLDADCIMNTNLRAVVLPATGEHTYDNDQDADCNVCGETREVATVIFGDANGDGAVNARDAALLQQYVAGVEVTLDMASGDANGDGAVNARDAALLQQYVAGWDVTLGA